MDGDKFLESLPKTFTYRLKEYTDLDNGVNYRAVFYASIKNMEDVSTWIQDFSRETRSNWNVHRTYANLKLQQRKDFICHMSTFRKNVQKGLKSQHRYKNCDCPAKIAIKIRKDTCDARRRYHWVHDGMPAEVTVEYNHNHGINNADALSFRKIDPATRETFYGYFDQGLSAASAAEYHLNQLEMGLNCDESAAMIRADAALNPKSSTIYYWYSLWRQLNFGDRTGVGMFQVLEEKVAEYMASGSLVSISREPLTIAILTPIMQRAHQLPSASEVAFVDSTASCDADNHVITFVLVLSPYGAVPAGVIITAGQSREQYVSGFSALNNLLGCRGFNGRGCPSSFITDDSAAERSALEEVWPHARLLLCHFHVLQAVWRWLWDLKNDICKDDRKMLMQGFRAVLYSADRMEAEQLFMELLHIGKSSQRFQQYVGSLWCRREVWCLAWRNIPELRGHHTNNYAEITVRLFKDNILTRCKAYNASAIVDFVVVVMEQFYRKRLERFANGRVTMYHMLLEKLLASCSYITDKNDIQVVTSSSGITYLVPSQHDSHFLYEVDVAAGACSCPEGMSGKCCKHQVAVFKWFDEVLPNMPPTTDADRYAAAHLALGELTPPESFYMSRTSHDSIHVTPTTDNRSAAASMSCDTHENIAISVNEAPTESLPTVAEKWNTLSLEIESLLNTHASSFCHHEMLNEMKKIQDRLKNIKTGSQLMTFMTSFGCLVPRRHRSGAAIRTQPTAASRRKRPGITHGAKRQSAGRPPKGHLGGVKRPRNLSKNINAGVPNAKAHGQGH